MREGGLMRESRQFGKRRTRLLSPLNSAAEGRAAIIDEPGLAGVMGETTTNPLLPGGSSPVGGGEGKG